MVNSSSKKQYNSSQMLQDAVQKQMGNATVAILIFYTQSQPITKTSPTRKQHTRKKTLKMAFTLPFCENYKNKMQFV